MIEQAPKKSLGQHWLNDPDSLDAMCQAADITPDDTVLEIGPGLGTLTQLLVLKAREVIAVEFDETLANNLPTRIQASNLRVETQDILRFDLTKLPKDYKVVANIPYYLTSNLLRVLSESENPPVQMALLVQKEVAQRVCARPGDMSLLSVSVQLYYHASLGEVVPRGLFTPPPKVDSQILKLTRREQPLFPDLDTKKFFQVVKAGFANRRKTLLNSLAAGKRLTKSEAGEIIANTKINPQSRPQELSLEEWYALQREVK